MTESTTQTSHRILEGWDDERCPILCGIFRPDDSVSMVKVETDSSSGNPIRLRVINHSTVNDLERLKPLDWTYLTQLCEAHSPSMGRSAVAGEGGYGGDGFVALLNERKELLWLAFFDCSNPFTKLTIVDQQVVAFSSLGNEWRFLFESPETATIQPEGTLVLE